MLWRILDLYTRPTVTSLTGLIESPAFHPNAQSSPLSRVLAEVANGAGSPLNGCLWFSNDIQLARRPAETLIQLQAFQARLGFIVICSIVVCCVSAASAHPGA